MIITFCGHADFQKTETYERELLAILDAIIGDGSAELYLGGYGLFDAFAFECGKKYRKSHPKAALVFVTPYLKESELHRCLESRQNEYDAVVYPPLESVPPRFAILLRNRFMTDQADCVIAFVAHHWGGAYQTYIYARKKGKLILNLAERKLGLTHGTEKTKRKRNE